jgi:hypothetical protein
MTIIYENITVMNNSDSGDVEIRAPHNFTSAAAAAQGGEISFRLYGTNQEDTVSQTAEALGWNVTVFEPLQNGTIIINATNLVS